MVQDDRIGTIALQVFEYFSILRLPLSSPLVQIPPHNRDKLRGWKAEREREEGKKRKRERERGRSKGRAGGRKTTGAARFAHNFHVVVAAAAVSLRENKVWLPARALARGKERREGRGQRVGGEGRNGSEALINISPGFEARLN